MRHTSEYIASMLLNTCKKWGIKSDRVTTVVTDNAVNMVNAIDTSFGKKKHIPCFAHTLNLVAQSVLQYLDLQNIVSKMKSIVTWFKQSCVASDELRKAITTETKLIQDVPTRWNSTYYMVNRFLELRGPINDTVIRHKSAPPMLTDMELSISSAVLPVLWPLKAATKEISADKYTSSSKITPIVHRMTSKIKSLSIKEPITKKVQNITLRGINKRMGAIEYVTPLAMATVLDPRFKNLHFTDPVVCANAVQKIKELIKDIIEEGDSVESDSSDSSDKPEESFNLWTDHH